MNLYNESDHRWSDTYMHIQNPFHNHPADLFFISAAIYYSIQGIYVCKQRIDRVYYTLLIIN